MVEDSVTRPVPHAVIVANSLVMLALIGYLEL